MGKARALSLIAEGKTSDAINHLFDIVSVYKTERDICKGHQFSDAYIKLVELSSRFRRIESAFMGDFIQFIDYEMVVNKITHSLINYVKDIEDN